MGLTFRQRKTFQYLILWFGTTKIVGSFIQIYLILDIGCNYGRNDLTIKKTSKRKRHSTPKYTSNPFPLFISRWSPNNLNIAPEHYANRRAGHMTHRRRMAAGGRLQEPTVETYAKQSKESVLLIQLRGVDDCYCSEFVILQFNHEYQGQLL